MAFIRIPRWKYLSTYTFWGAMLHRVHPNRIHPKILSTTKSLVASTHLEKYARQIASFRQVEVNVQKSLKPPRNSHKHSKPTQDFGQQLN